MSHGDHVEQPPPGYVVTAPSNGNPITAFRHETRPIYGVQFHPEVAHTPRGGEIISNFLFDVCKAEPSWTPARSSRRNREDPGAGRRSRR